MEAYINEVVGPPEGHVKGRKSAEGKFDLYWLRRRWYGCPSAMRREIRGLPSPKACLAPCVSIAVGFAISGGS